MFRFALKVFPFPCYAITAGPTRNPARVIHCQSRLFVRSSTLTFASNWPVRSLSSPFFRPPSIHAPGSVDRITRVKEEGEQGRRKEEIERGNGGVHAFREIHRDFPDASSKGATPPIPLARPLLLFSHGHARNGFRVYYSWWWCKVALASMSIALMEIGTIARGIFPTIARTHS